LSLFENAVLQQILELKREEVVGNWKSSCIEGTLDLFSLAYTTRNDQVKESEMSGTCSRNESEEEFSQGIDGEK
jgi:hypothetical protein